MSRIQGINPWCHATPVGEYIFPVLEAFCKQLFSTKAVASVQDRREDTSLQLAHFRRHKRKLQKKNLGRTTINHLHAPVEKHAPGKDSTNKIANVIGKAAKYANSAKAKKVNVMQSFMYLPEYHQLRCSFIADAF